MANMNVTYADMNSAAAHLRTGKGEMETKLAELGSAIDGLVQNGFVTDQASHSYQQEFHSFQGGLTKAIDALENLAQYLDQAAQALHDTDQHLSQAIQSH